jgi:uncharacterized protein (DUF58 family)
MPAEPQRRLEPPDAGPANTVRITLTPRGKIVGTLLFLTAWAAFVGAEPTARTATALLAAVLIADRVARFGPRPRLAVMASTHPLRLRPGTTADEPLVLVDLGGRGLDGLSISDRKMGRGQDPAWIERLPARGQVPFRNAIRARRRGVVRERPFEITSEWPFGLWRTSVIVPCAVPVLVEPSRQLADVDALLAGAPTSAGRRATDGRSSRPARDDPAGEFHALRETRGGEDVRRIHALRSAALGVPVTRLHRAPRQRPDLDVLLDLRLAPGTSATHPAVVARLERDLGTVATLCDLAAAGAIQLDLTVAHAPAGQRIDEFRVDSAAVARTVLAVLSEASFCRWFNAERISAAVRFEPGRQTGRMTSYAQELTA